MRVGLIAEKLGMTRIFSETAQHIPVTVLKIEDCQIIDLKKVEKNGYNAIQVGAKNKKVKRVIKPLQGFYNKVKLPPKTVLKEFRVDSLEEIEIGKELTVLHFEIGQYVDIQGKTIGKGFAGAMKRWNFGGLRASHGVSVSHRSHGSTGQRQDPGRTFKNKKMAGHLGDSLVTVQNLEIVHRDEEKKLLFVKGAVPGSNGTFVFVKDAIKKK